MHGAKFEKIVAFLHRILFLKILLFDYSGMRIPTLGWNSGVFYKIGIELYIKSNSLIHGMIHIEARLWS